MSTSLSENAARKSCVLGIALAAQGKHDAALAQYVEAIRLDPQQVQAHYNMGNSLVYLGRSAEAATQYREVLRINPGLRAAQENLDRVLGMQGTH
jgi:tetratricopeptide (TPR) repeat protein